ncbi:MAG: T9SS type A sorting domain-containing protein [Flavobacteriales bacterium]|nr:T9SS type A sorting domain-containing protein [Flavobacteriales bacterium]
MKNFTLTFLFLCASIAQLAAQYTTPGTGVDWILDDIAAASPSTVTISGTTYTLLENITIAADDIVRINTDITLEIEAGVRITVLGLGSFFVEADDVTITAVNEAAPYDGFRFEEFSDISIQNATIQFSGGLQVLTETFVLNNCVLTNNVSGVTTGATVTLSRGIPVITNNQFLFNANPAISSGVNQSVSAFIANNYIEGNNQTNNNRPQINMGATRVNDTLKIINNSIIGDRDLEQAGGIAVANLVGGALRAIIEGNTITDNRYGITVVGPNSYALIKDNIFEDNDTQGNPNLGGSGINLNAPTGSMTVDVTGNQIRRNLWGVTIQGPVDANFGDDADNPGLNVFSENGNNGNIFALYNNGPNTILAKNNCWAEDGEGTLAEAEAVIFHLEDDATLGEVIFDPIHCEAVAGIEDTILENFVFYPNPAKKVITFTNTVAFQTLEIYDVQGKRMYSRQIFQGANSVILNLPAGMYFASFSNENNKVVKKLLVK